jgi:hypothetical protein
MENERKNKMETILIFPAYISSKKKSQPKHWRGLSIEEIKQLQPGQRVKFISSLMGDVRECKVNGKPKTWKTRLNDIKVPLKYGLYEYAYAEYINGVSVGVTLVKEIENEINL